MLVNNKSHGSGVWTHQYLPFHTEGTLDTSHGGGYSPAWLPFGNNGLFLMTGSKDATTGNSDIKFDRGAVIENASFEGDAATQTPTGWNTWCGSSGTNCDADFTETNSGGHYGSLHGTHYKASAYEVDTYQNVTGLKNGSYTLKAWVKSSGGQNAVYMEAKNYGGSDLSVAIPATNTWTAIEIPNVNVTNGTCTIGFYCNANAGKWIHFVDAYLTRN